MLTLPKAVKIYIASKPVDMRRGFDGLSAIVLNQFGLDPYSGHLFCFVGKRLDRVKLLYFDHAGFTLLYRRLERGRFRWPHIDEAQQTALIEAAQLTMLLEGIDLRRVKKPKRWTPPSEE